MPSEPDLAGLQRVFHAEFWRAPAAIAAIGFDGRMLCCNAAYGEIVGADPDELVGTDSAAFVHPEEVDQAVAESVERIETRETKDSRLTPIRLIRRDGGIVWVQFDSLIVDDAPGDPYVLATMTDVSAQVAAQQALDRSDYWFRTLLQHQSDIVTVVDLEGVVSYISPNCERLLGFRADELIGHSGFESIHPDDIDALTEGLTAQLSGAVDARPIEYRQHCRDGSWLWLEASVRELPSELGTPAVIVSSRDVSERRRAEAATRETEDRFRSAFLTSPLGIAFADLDGKFTWVNQALSTTLGVPEAKLLEMSFLDFLDRDDFKKRLLDTRRLLRGAIETFASEQLYEQPEGSVIWARMQVSLVRNADGTPAHFLGQLEDITERKRRELSLTHDALHDPLTGLLNRVGLRELVDEAWMTRSSDTPMAILFGDLDGFKSVNDRLGHDAGDEVLVQVAERLRNAVRGDDVVARWGGDEFVILCPKVGNLADATLVADRVRIALEAAFHLGQGYAEIAISIGVALDTGQPLPDLLIKDADAAAYRAKALGRNQVVVA